jgi:flagellin
MPVSRIAASGGSMASQSPASLAQQTLALLRQEALANALIQGGSLDAFVVNTLLRPGQRSGREISAAALTGRIRSDAGMLRQASLNVQEGGSIFSLAAGAVSSIADALEEMQKLAQSVVDHTAGSDATISYENLASSIAGLVAGAEYNGIALLDGSKWPGDKRLTPGTDTASLSIQAGNSAMTLTLHDLSALKTAFQASDLGDDDAAKNTVAILSTLLANAKSLASSYTALAGSYSSEARSIARQAGILDLTAAGAEAGAGRDPKSILLDLLLRDRGNLFDTSS